MKRFRLGIVLALGLCAAALATSRLSGQQSQPPAPPANSAPRAQPAPRIQPLLNPDGRIREDAFLSGPALSGNDRVYADIDGRRMKTIVNDFVAIARRSRDDGNRYWGRIAGTPYEVMTGDLVESRFKSFGLTDVHRQEFPLQPQWFPTDWSLSTAQGGKTETFRTTQPALSSVPISGELDVEAVWVGLGTAADFAGRDVRGKAVVFHTMLAPGEMGQSAVFEGTIQRAEKAGAAALIGIWGYYDNYAVWQSLGQTVYSADVKIPGFWIGFEDGKRLREQLATGTTRAKMRLTTEMRQGLKTQSVYGTLRGNTDENVIVLAHMDGWFDGALDNASGLSVMLTLAEHFSKLPQSSRRRNMIFVGTAGHHVGSPNSTYLRDERRDILNKTALLINCEHVAAAQTLNWSTTLRETNSVAARRWWVNGSRALTDGVVTAFHTFGVNVVGDMDPSASGEMGAIARLAPSMQIIHSPEIKHTDHDNPEIVPAVGLESVGRAFANAIDRANQLDLAALKPPAPAAPATRQP